MATDAPVDLLYTFDLGGRKGSDGDAAPTSSAAGSNIVRPDGQWCVYRVPTGGVGLPVYVDGPVTTAGSSVGLSGDGFGGWRSVSVGLTVPSSLWDVLAENSTPLPDDAMGYVGVVFAPGSELSSSLVSAVSRRDFSSGRWLFEVRFSSGTGEFGPGLNNEIFESARFHLAVTGVGTPPPPTQLFWTGFVGASEIGGEIGGESTSGGSTPASATAVTLPFTTSLGAIGAGSARWFKVTAGSGLHLFSTVGSPSPEGYDTHIAVYDESGALVAENDDVDLIGGDYRSEVEGVLTAGTYYLAVGGYGATVGNGFTFSGAASLIAGTVLNIEAF